MLRVSATSLEQWRLFCETDWMLETELLKSIKGELVQTPAMKLGRSFHYLLEHPQLNLDGVYEHNELRFERDVIDGLLALLPGGGVFETKIERVIGKTRDEEDVRLVAKADYCAGLHVFEFKAPQSAFDAEKYERSLQWKVYAMLYEARMITYHVSQLADEDGVYRLKELSSMTLYPYAELEREVKEHVRAFLRYVRNKGLEDYLRPKTAEAVAR